MGWFDEQLRQRKQLDDDRLADAMDALSDAVAGKRKKTAEAATAEETAAADSGYMNSAVDDILAFYHHSSRLSETPPPATEESEQLECRLRPYGILHRTVRLDSGWYRHAVGAMLGKRKDTGSVAALIPGKLSGYRFRDPKTGKQIRLNRKTARLFEEEAECFYPPLPQKSLTVADLLTFMAKQLSVSDIAMLIGLTALSALLGLLSPLLTRWLFGEVLLSGSTQMLLALGGFMIGYSVCRICFAAFQTLTQARIGIKQNIAVEAAVMSRILNLPASFFKDYAAGELTQRAQYVQALCSTLIRSIGSTALTSLFSLIYLGQIFHFAPSLVLPSLLITAATAVLSLLTASFQIRVAREQMELSAKTSGLTYATITGIQKIKLAGAETRMFSRWVRQFAREAAATYTPPLFLRLSDTIRLALTLAGSMILYAAAIKNHVSVADYYAFNAAYGMVSSAFLSLASIAASFAGIRPTLEMAKPILEAEPEYSEGKERITELSGEIELSHVSFRYSDAMPNVIDDLSLTIASGEYVAIVGATGSGKSTLIRLLLGFEQPQKGTIDYDHHALSQLDLQSLRQRIGVVMQDGQLFHGDIFSNIALSSPQLTLDEAWEAAEIASVAEDIRAMPMGMRTILREGSGGISGGQRQRLMIARAVAPKPKVLLFDEATSALDNVTQKKVSDAIEKLQCTRVVIAHRLSTIRHADRILLLQQGKIAEEGTYEELMKKNGAFAELIVRQRLDAG